MAFEVADGFEDAAADAPPGNGGEEVFDRVQPGRRGRREVKKPSRMVREPGVHLGVLVGSVVVQNDVDDLARWDLALHGVEEFDELLMTVALHAAAEHGSVERGEQRGGSVALVIVGHGRAFPGFNGRPGCVRSSVWI
jgi:hypothetical protein